jgi:hypothetical protein
MVLNRNILLLLAAVVFPLMTAVLCASRPYYSPDFDESEFVDFKDFAVFSANWKHSGSGIDGDFDNNGAVDGDTTKNTNVAVIFIEEFRDYINTSGDNKTEALEVAHEVGHTGGGNHGDGGYNYIMGDEDGQFSGNASSFHPETLKIFRSHRTWLEKN